MRITTAKIRLFPAATACLAILLPGCAANDPAGDLLADPLKQRLLAREDIALQNLLLARTPAYSYAGGARGTYSYLDEPYDGPAIEPPLPDLNLLPEDMPPWEDFPEDAPQEPVPTPTPIEPVPTGADPAPEPETAPPPPQPEAKGETPVETAPVVPADGPAPAAPAAETAPPSPAQPAPEEPAAEQPSVTL